MARSYTNSSLSTARNCLMRFEYAYEMQLELVGRKTEALDVGTCWHKMQEAQTLGLDPYAVCVKHAPSPLWYHKLARMFAGHLWYWSDQEEDGWEPEATWRKQLISGQTLEGQIDGRLTRADGRRGIKEYKTTSDSVDPDSGYWSKLDMDTQVGLYGFAEDCPDFILYDAVRKPTIRPKKLTKAQLKQLGETLDSGDAYDHLGEALENDEHNGLAGAYDTGVESDAMFGVRLGQDIAERPGHYFARREVSRTQDDYATLLRQTDAQIRVIEHAQENGLMHRNTDGCDTIQKGRCPFIGLCQSNLTPEDVRDMPDAPEGFRFREHLHPELVPD